MVPIGGYVNSGKIELFPGGSRILGPGILANRSELSGSGTVEAVVNNNAGGTIDAINDVLTFTAAVTNNVGGQINAINSTLSFDAGLTNNGELNLINTTIVGSVVGSATGIATLVGSNSVSSDFTMSAADTLFVGLGGVLSSQFDTLAIGGDAILAGNLNVAFDPGFTPSAGDTFEILTAANVTSVFDTVNLPALTGDLLWFVNYNATSVKLVSTYGADFDEDGDVDDEDLIAWESGFGSAPATHMTGDANADTASGGFDFLAWQQQFGSGGAPLAALTTVLEPTSLLLAALGVLMLSKRRKYK